jgi:ABC-type ATPase involved in cell division
MPTQEFYVSARLKEQMGNLANAQLGFIVGGAGYGKSGLLHLFVSGHSDHSLHFLVTGNNLSAQYERLLSLLEKQDRSLADRLRVLPFPSDDWSFLRLSEI